MVRAWRSVSAVSPMHRVVPFLSPAKLLVVLVVAIVVLGPDKLPKVARQVGSLWGDFRRLRERLESDVRGNFPDLPSTEKITQAVRSPLTFLDSLADTHAADNEATGPAPDAGRPPDPVGEPVVASGAPTGRTERSRPTRSPPYPGYRSATPRAPSTPSVADTRGVPDDPSMNLSAVSRTTSTVVR